MKGVLFVFYEQLKQACKNKNTTVTSVLKQIGVGTANGTYWKNGSVPSSDIVVQLSEFLGVSTDYLLKGKEDDIKSNDISEDERDLLSVYNKLSKMSKGRVKERAEMLLEFETVKISETISTKYIELSPMAVSAGTGEPLIDDSYPKFIQVKDNDNTREANFAVQINGNSMEPFYDNDDIVLVKSQPEVAIDQVGIFIIDNEGFIKKRGADRLISLNPECEDVYFKEGQEIWCKGLVIGVLNEEDII